MMTNVHPIGVLVCCLWAASCTAASGPASAVGESPVEYTAPASAARPTDAPPVAAAKPTDAPPVAAAKPTDAPHVAVAAPADEAPVPAARTVSRSRPAGQPGDGPLADPARRKAFWTAIRSGRSATAGGKLDAAVTAYDAALAVAPDHPRALSGRGYARLLAGDLDGATEDLELALGMNPSREIQGAAHFNLGLVAEKRGDPAEAIRHFQLSNKVRPSKPAAKKLANSAPVCAVDIDNDDEEPRHFDSWLAFARVAMEDRAPATEAEARRVLCTVDDDDDDDGEGEDGCAGPGPWHIISDTGDFGQHHLALPDATGLLVLGLQTWGPGGGRCTSYEELAFGAGDPMLLTYRSGEGILTPVDADGEEECDEIEEDCEYACTDEMNVTLEYTLVDRKSLRRLMQVSATGVEIDAGGRQGGPQLAAKLVTGGLRITGDGCDQLLAVAP